MAIGAIPVRGVPSRAGRAGLGSLPIVSFFKRLRCMIGRHSPSRRKVQYDGHLKCGPCKYCGIALEKGDDGMWVPRRDI